MDLLLIFGAAGALVAYVKYSIRRDTLPFPPSSRDLDDLRRAKNAERIYNGFVQLLLGDDAETNAARVAGVAQVKSALLIQGLLHHRRGTLDAAQIKVLADGFGLAEIKLGPSMFGGLRAWEDCVRYLDALVSADVLARGASRPSDDALHALCTRLIQQGLG